MPTPPLPDALAQAALDLVEEYGTPHLAKVAGATDLPINTLRDRVRLARLRGLKPTIRKDAPRVYTRQRLGQCHMVIPDTQVRPHVNTDHFEWAANFANEKKPDVIIHIGDHFDMPSLSTYDKGKTAFEGRRYVNDIKAGRDAMERFITRLAYKPRLVFCTGNHEHRIQRVVDLNAEYQGKFDMEDMGLKDYGWEVIPFLKPIEIDGVRYCHYFTSGVMGRPTSSAATLLREQQQSATMGHVQHSDLAMHRKTQQRALFCGTFYSHHEEYLGWQGNDQRRQIIIKHEVSEGRYDLMEVSLKFLSKAYS
jgi:calcineurin-like phosphoesterase family protein